MSKEREFIDVSFGLTEIDKAPNDYVNRWNKPVVTWDNLQEFIHFTTNLGIDHALSCGCEVEYRFTTWHYRKQSYFDLNAINENFIYDKDAAPSRDHVTEFLNMANSSDSPSDYYYDRDICTGWLYDDEEDEWYENEEDPCYCDKCMEEDQRRMEEYEKDHPD